MFELYAINTEMMQRVPLPSSATTVRTVAHLSDAGGQEAAIQQDGHNKASVNRRRYKGAVHHIHFHQRLISPGSNISMEGRQIKRVNPGVV